MTCATSTLKFLAFVMNVLCCIFGAFMLSASVYALVVFNASDSVRGPCIAGIVLGSLLFLTTILGCCGAIKESSRSIWIYAIFLLLLMGAQIGIIFLLPMNFKHLAAETITNAWNNQLSGDLMESYEIEYGCCGKNGPEDYIQSGLKVPASCYRNQNASIDVDMYVEGCIERLEEEFSHSAHIEVIGDWSLVAIEGATIIVAAILAINFTNLERRRTYR